MRIFSILALICLALVNSSPVPVEKIPKQYVKQTVVLGRKLPINGTSLTVCMKTETDGEKCDILKTTAHFDLEAKRQAGWYGLMMAMHPLRLFSEVSAKTKKNMFETKEVTLTLRNLHNDKMMKTKLNADMIASLQKNTYWMVLMNDTHPLQYMKDVINALTIFDLAGDDSQIRDQMLVAVKMEAYCAEGYYGQDCVEYCPQGCVHGTCSDGVCNDCEFPYHGAACDRCGEYGNCEHGQCAVMDPTDTMSAQCVCDRLFEGIHCEILHLNCSVVPCAPNGKCNRETARCECESRFKGDHCEIYYYWGSWHSVFDVLSVMAFGLVGVFFAFICIKMKMGPSDDCDCGADEEMQELAKPEAEEPANADPHRVILDESLLEDIRLGRETHL